MKSSIFETALVFCALGSASAYLVDPPTTAASDTVQDCSGWVVTASGDTCTSLSADNGLTDDQFKTYVNLNKRRYASHS
jgi:hypothetical protein